MPDACARCRLGRFRTLRPYAVKPVLRLRLLTAGLRVRAQARLHVQVIYFFPFFGMAETPTPSAQDRDERICRERHAEKMDRLRDTIARLNDPNTSDEQRDALREEYANDVLSIEPLRALKITLSWGGPSDGYRLLFAKDGEEALSGVYWYADWFTYAETALSREELQWVQEAFLSGQPSLYFQ